MRRPLLPALALAWLALGSGPARAAEPPPLTVFAAADLVFAFKEIVPRFEKALGVRVTLVLGSTGQLAQQIEHGGPADVFFAADQAFVDRLVAERVLLGETRALYAQGRIVLATARAIGWKLTELRDLTGPNVRHVAIANPAHAPYGKAAEEALRKAGVWDAVRPKLVYGENIRHTLQFLQTGAAEAGIVASSVANVPEIDWVPIDPRLHAPLNQATAVVRRSPRPELGLAFIQFVNGPDGRPIMKRYGFLLPGEFWADDGLVPRLALPARRAHGDGAHAARWRSHRPPARPQALPRTERPRGHGRPPAGAPAHGARLLPARGDRKPRPRRAGTCRGRRQVRDHTDGGGEHPGRDANPAAGDLRPRAGRADGRGERARADRRRRRRGAALRPEPAGAASLLAVVSVEIVKRYPGFTLDVSWRAEKSVVGLFGPSGARKTLTLHCLAGHRRGSRFAAPRRPRAGE